MKVKINRMYEMCVSSGEIRWIVGVVAVDDADDGLVQELGRGYERQALREGELYVQAKGFYVEGYAHTLEEARAVARKVCDEFVTYAREALRAVKEAAEAYEEKVVEL